MNKTIFVPYLNKECSVSLYGFLDNTGHIIYGVSHDSLEYLLREECQGVKCEINVITANEKYAAVQVNVFDQLGRSVSDIADVNINTLDNNSANMNNFIQAHPLVFAKNNAFDAAVRKFLNIPRIINAENETENLNYSENTEYENYAEEINKSDNKKINEEELLFGNPFSNQIFKSGSFAGCTYAQVWKMSPGYLQRAKKWKGYETVNEFLKYMEE